MSDLIKASPEAFKTPKVTKPVVKKQALSRTADTLKPKQRQQIADFRLVLGYIAAIEVPSQSLKINLFIAQCNERKLPPNVKNSLTRLRGKQSSKSPTRATLYRWMDKLLHYKNGDTLALTSRNKGSIRKVYSWEQKALELFNLPSKPGYFDVAYWLRNDFGFEDASNRRVHRFIKTLPETLGKNSKYRMGKDFYKHNIAPHKVRNNEVLAVGVGYEGDGHTVDAYVAHPATGNLYRPELTVWIDVRSRYIVGWYLSDSESAISTLFALSHALVSEDHVPAVLFLDNGSGFKARMMNDEITGFFSKMSITPNWALPGNSKGKGLVEGFFKIYRNRFDKRFDTYCGHDMAPEINRRLPEEVKNGTRKLPSYYDYFEGVKKFITEYNNTPKGVLDGKTPNDLWTTLKRTPVEMDADALIQPRVIRTVRKWQVTLHNRTYQAAELAAYNGRKLMVEYSLHNDSTVRVLDEDQVLICVAELIGKVDRLPDSRIVEAEQKREKGQIKRHQVHIDEIKQRSKPIISLEQTAEKIIEISGEAIEEINEEAAYESLADFSDIEDEKVSNVADMFE